MFSFHKPKVYRSTQGCCICKAKSSSSRFTDSKKYENDFIECFQLMSPRKGEICNACVLLVKRFKRLPPGSDRHWGHVVDARVGPGLKSMTKFKKRKEEQQQQMISNVGAAIVPAAVNVSTASVSRSLSSMPEKFCKIFKKNKKKKLLESTKKYAEPVKPCDTMHEERENVNIASLVVRTSPNHCSSINDLLCDEMLDSPNSPISQNHSDDNDIGNPLNIYNPAAVHDSDRVMMKNNEMNRNFIEQILNVHENSRHNYHQQLQHHHYNQHHPNRRRVCKRKIRQPVKNFGSRIIKEAGGGSGASFIDANCWKKVKTCCGYVYESNITNAVIIDCDLYKKCITHKNIICSNIDSSKTIQLNSKLLFNEKENFTTTTTTLKTKIADNVNVPVTAIKKHHLYSKRQNFINNSANNNNISNNSIIHNNIKTDLTILQPPLIIPPVHHHGTTSSHQSNTTIINNNSVTAKYLHKIKSDSKITKNGDILKPATISTAKLKTADFNMVKNLMKICTDKTIKHKNLDKLATIAVNGGSAGVVSESVSPPGVADSGGSDSGYEETPHEQHGNIKPTLKKPLIHQGVRSVVLANGIKVHVQPQNLERAVNWAGVPQTTVASLQQQSENMQQQHYNGSQPTSNIIVVQQKPTIDHLILPNQSASNNLNISSNNMIIDTMGTANICSGNNSATNLSQNIVLIKPKYLQQNC